MAVSGKKTLNFYKRSYHYSLMKESAATDQLSRLESNIFKI